jgi:hypothetical protein
LVESIELSAVLRRHEISSPTLRDKEVPGVCENRVLRGKCRQLYDEELHNLYPSPNITRRIRWAEHVALVGDKRSTYRVLVWKAEGRRPLGRSSTDGRILKSKSGS